MKGTEPVRPLAEVESFMRQALEQARRGWKAGEIPVGAVVVDPRGAVVGKGYNRTITDRDPSAHAEVVAIRAAGRNVGNHRLDGHTVFTTVEPCLMCLGLLIHARIHSLYFGAEDPRVGAVDGIFRQLEQQGGFNHRFRINRGLLEAECREILQSFFSIRRGSGTDGGRSR